MTYRLSLSFDRTTGRFHHYEVWLASARSAFVAHVCDLVPGTSRDEAYDFLAGMAG